MALPTVDFEEIQPYEWYAIEAGDYDLSGFTMLFAKKTSNDEWLVFDYSPADGWVENPPTIMNREEWDKYDRGKFISKIVTKRSGDWSEIAKDAMKTIFLSSAEFFDQKE